MDSSRGDIFSFGAFAATPPVAGALQPEQVPALRQAPAGCAGVVAGVLLLAVPEAA